MSAMVGNSLNWTAINHSSRSDERQAVVMAAAARPRIMSSVIIAREIGAKRMRSHTQCRLPSAATPASERVQRRATTARSATATAAAPMENGDA